MITSKLSQARLPCSIWPLSLIVLTWSLVRPKHLLKSSHWRSPFCSTTTWSRVSCSGDLRICISLDWGMMCGCEIVEYYLMYPIVVTTLVMAGRSPNHAVSCYDQHNVCSDYRPSTESSCSRVDAWGWFEHNLADTTPILEDVRPCKAHIWAIKSKNWFARPDAFDNVHGTSPRQ